MRRGGAMLFVVAAAVLVIELLVVSFHKRSLDARWLSRKAHGRDVTAHLAWAARSAALAAVRRDLANPSSSQVLALLTRHAPADLDAMRVPLPAGWERPELEDMVRRAGARVDVEATLRGWSALPGASLANGMDAIEKHGLFDTLVRVTQGGTERTYQYATRVKVVNLVPPVLTRFALFVRTPERAGYNRYWNDAQGDAVDRAGSVRPLALRPDRHAARAGLAYLGGEDATTLHLTAGTPQETRREPIAGGCAGGAVSYLTEHARTGFHAGEEVALSTELGTTRTAASAMLHLGGARVYGRVYRSVIERARLAADTGGDGEGDTRIATLSNVAWHAYPWQLPELPAAVGGLDLSCLKSHDPGVHDFGALFGDHASYAQVMSRVVDEPYDARGMDDGGAFALDAASGAPLMRGDLAGMAPALVERAGVTVSDGAAFLARYVKDGRLALDSVVHVARGDLQLPAGLTIERGGMVIVAGRIVSRGIEGATGQPLVLCSLDSDVVLDTARPHRLAAIALSGRVRATGGAALDLTGSVAAGRLVPDDLAPGGTLTYDADLDPTSRDREKLYRGLVAEHDEEWMLP